MKKSTLLFAMILMGFISFAQNTYNLVIFSEDGEPFYAFANGIRQNDKPETNVKIVGLNAENLMVRIQFENKALPVIKQNMFLEYGYEHTANLRQNSKKVMKMQYFGKVALADAPQGNASVVQYHTSENPISSESTQVNTAASTTPVSDHSTVNTTVTSHTVTTGSTPENVNINIGMGGVGISMNVNENMGNASMQTTSSTTVTTTSSSSSSSSASSPKGAIKNPSPSSDAAIQPVNTGCSAPMAPASFEQMKKSIESKPFSDTKMSTAKVATKNACLSASQIKTICKLFAMDDDKLVYAKYAYDYCTDKANYYQVSEVFSFSSTTDELNSFLESH